MPGTVSTTLAATLAATAALGAAAVGGIPDPAISTVKLSQPRRALAGASVGDAAVFGGGCAAEPNTYVCDTPSDVIDVLRPSSIGGGAAAVYALDTNNTAALSTARGWPTACSAGGVVAFLGGGKEGTEPHSRALDLFDVAAGSVATNETALETGLWGQACAAAGGSIFFGGGKVITTGSLKPAMTDLVSELVTDAQGRPSVDGLRPVGHLSLAREATGSVAYGDVGVLFAGGEGPWPPVSVPIVDAFDVPFAAGEDPHTWTIDKIPDPQSIDEYWIGAAKWNSTASYLLDNKTLYAVNSLAVFKGTAPPVRTEVPFESSAPSARLGENGVGVDGVGVCFYSAAPTSALVCYSPDSGLFAQYPCSATHIAGAIVSAGKTVFVAGGADMAGHATDVVDVFQWS